MWFCHLVLGIHQHLGMCGLPVPRASHALGCPSSPWTQYFTREQENGETALHRLHENVSVGLYLPRQGPQNQHPSQQQLPLVMAVGMSLAWSQDPAGSSLSLPLVTVVIPDSQVPGPLALQDLALTCVSSSVVGNVQHKVKGPL